MLGVDVGRNLYFSRVILSETIGAPDEELKLYNVNKNSKRLIYKHSCKTNYNIIIRWFNSIYQVTMSPELRHKERNNVLSL